MGKKWSKEGSTRDLAANPAAKGGEDSVRKERISMRLQPVVDPRFGGISEERATTLIILEFYSAIHESHRVTAADPSAPSSCADSQADAHNLARRNPSRQETWQSWWWSDDSKWNTWSCWSQDDWRETESSSQFMFTIFGEGDQPPKMAIFQLPTGGVNNTLTTTTHFQR